MAFSVKEKRKPTQNQMSLDSDIRPSAVDSQMELLLVISDATYRPVSLLRELKN